MADIEKRQLLKLMLTSAYAIPLMATLSGKQDDADDATPIQMANDPFDGAGRRGKGKGSKGHSKGGGKKA